MPTLTKCLICKKDMNTMEDFCKTCLDERCETCNYCNSKVEQLSNAFGGSDICEHCFDEAYR